MEELFKILEKIIAKEVEKQLKAYKLTQDN